jgi:hypothetical protein
LATPLLPKGVIENKFNDWLMRAGKETSWGLAVDEFVGLKKGVERGYKKKRTSQVLTRFSVLGSAG